MTDHVLAKGANVSLLPRSADGEGRLQAVVRWSDPVGGTDVDVSALLLGSDGQVRSDEDFVFYNAPVAADGAVRLLGKRSDDAAAEDSVAVDLESLPADVERILIAASIDPASQATGFGDLGDIGLVLLGTDGTPAARYDIAGAGSETTMVLGEIYARGQEWKFRAVGQGWDSGLAGLATDHGIRIEDAEPGPDPLDTA
ncbi:TerD family protein, partial [Pseudonocardia abyssalis]